MGLNHLADHDLERYYLGMVTDETELAMLEGHLLACPECEGRAEHSDALVDLIRQAIIMGNYDIFASAR